MKSYVFVYHFRVALQFCGELVDNTEDIPLRSGYFTPEDAVYKIKINEK